MWSCFPSFDADCVFCDLLKTSQNSSQNISDHNNDATGFFDITLFGGASRTEQVCVNILYMIFSTHHTKRINPVVFMWLVIHPQHSNSDNEALRPGGIYMTKSCLFMFVFIGII